ncbi:MAG: hypothetical protein JJ916_12635 [Phycisphaerales bacterium]|nr:hypothetical protein [Phycisphaerales bacterium]
MDKIKVHPSQTEYVDKEHLNRLYQYALELAPPGSDPEYASELRLGLSIEDFFEGNRAGDSIACNLYPDHPGIETFRSVLTSIRDRKDVFDVQIQLGDFESDPDGVCWPYAEYVYIYTKQRKAKIKKWLAPLRPDELNFAQFLGGKPHNAPKLPLFTWAWAAWWD